MKGIRDEGNTCRIRRCITGTGIYDDVLLTMQRTDLPNWIKYLGANEKILKGNWEKFRYTIVMVNSPCC